MANNRREDEPVNYYLPVTVRWDNFPPRIYLVTKVSRDDKTAINAVYGLTSAAFPNKLKDPRNVDNIVAKRGALFMLTLKHKLIDMGVTIVHISTDSIKIANATPEIIKFIVDFGARYACLRARGDC